MRKMLQYKKEARDNYFKWNDKEYDVEYCLIREVYIKLRSLGRKETKFEAWLKTCIEYLEDLLDALITQSKKYKFFRSTGRKFEESSYWGMRLATSKCLLVFNCFKTEDEKNVPSKNIF